MDVGIMNPVDESNIEAVEAQTLERVNQTITVLEGALATWDSSKEKPVELSNRFEKYRRLHKALSNWEVEFLRARQKANPDERLKRLNEFVEICYTNA